MKRKAKKVKLSFVISVVHEHTCKKFTRLQNWKEQNSNYYTKYVTVNMKMYTNTLPLNGKK